MPKPLHEIPKVTDNDLIADSRLERIWRDLTREFRFDFETIGLVMLTWIAPGGWRVRRGVQVFTGPQACFLVRSDNPNEKGDPISSYGMTDLSDFKKAEKESGQFFQNGDPALSILRQLVFENLKTRGVIRGLEGINEEEYQKRLDQANWVLEQTAGSRFDEVKMS